MKAIAIRTVIAAAAAAAFSVCAFDTAAQESQWQDEFGVSKCALQTSGRNQYFVLELGYQTLLEGPGTRLLVTVLDETKTIDGVTTRAVEEREWKKGELFEVARDYYAICGETGDVFYFGEEVDYYEHGKVTRHDGSWVAEKGNRPGLVMPAKPRLNMKYYREIAPAAAMDRAEIVSLDETCLTPAGSFSNCMKIRETSPLDPTLLEYKWYAPGIGLAANDTVRLVKYGPATADGSYVQGGRQASIDP